jgi:vitamin B12/bleomycin/antimicrobial peptide transport system ATP-binding/permease protein
VIKRAGRQNLRYDHPASIGSGLRLMPFLILLSGLASALGLAGAAGAGWFGGVPLYVAAAGVIMTVCVVMARTVGPFLRFFVVFYALGYIGLISLIVLQPLLPSAWAAYAPPPLTAFTAAAFAILAFALSKVPVMRQITEITDPYFATDERADFELIEGRPFRFPVKWMAMGLLAIVILINLGQVWISVSLSFFNRNWFDAIQAKNAVEFWRLLYQVWLPLVGVLIATNFIEFLIVSAFKIAGGPGSPSGCSAAGWGTARTIGCNLAMHVSTTPTSAYPRISASTSRRPTASPFR